MQDQGARAQCLDRLAEAVASTALDHPTRVAIDGPPASGKTTLADELAQVLRRRGGNVIRACIDDFMIVGDVRYRRGLYSGEACYFDSHDHESLNRVLLDPLGPGGDRRFQTTVYDRATDTVISPPMQSAPEDAVLLFDGVFLMRPELDDRWDLRVFVSAAFDTTVERALVRESGADTERRWRERYIPAQQIYFAAVNPTERADIVVHNDDLQQPVLDVRES